MPIDLPALEEFRARGEDEREFVLPELLDIGWSPESSAEERAGSLANFNYRMVEVVMMIMLPLLAVALAIPPKRSTSALGVFLSIVVVVAYHKINQYGSEVAALGDLDPFVALWGPFAVLALVIGWMFYQIAFVPGGQAIGFLEILLRQDRPDDEPVVRTQALAGTGAREPVRGGRRSGGAGCRLISSPHGG